MSNTPVLHLLHVQPDTRLLATWMVRYRTQDEGEALHGLLRAAFGTQAPQPFRYLDEQRGLLAYTALDGAALEQATALADPQAARTCKASPFARGGLCAYWPVKFDAMKLPAGVKNM